VYVLRSESDSGFYIGFSADLKRRLSEHKRGASFATKSRGPWKLIYYEAYLNQEDALGREKYLKYIRQTISPSATQTLSLARTGYSTASPSGIEGRGCLRGRAAPDGVSCAPNYAIIWNDSPRAPATPIMPRRPTSRPREVKPLRSSHVSERFYVVTCAREQSPGRVSRHDARANSRRETRRR
jgi:putative endonuclease